MNKQTFIATILRGWHQLGGNPDKIPTALEFDDMFNEFSTNLKYATDELLKRSFSDLIFKRITVEPSYGILSLKFVVEVFIESMEYNRIKGLKQPKREELPQLPAPPVDNWTLLESCRECFLDTGILTVDFAFTYMTNILGRNFKREFIQQFESTINNDSEKVIKERLVKFVLTDGWNDFVKHNKK